MSASIDPAEKSTTSNVAFSNGASANIIYTVQNSSKYPDYVEDKLVLDFTSEVGVKVEKVLYDEFESPNGPLPATQKILNPPKIQLNSNNDTLSVTYDFTIVDGQHDYPGYFPASGVLSQTNIYDDNGKLISSFEHDINGYNILQRFNSSGQLTYSYERFDQDYGDTLAGTTIQVTIDPATGKAYNYTRNPDGSFTTFENQIHGKDYVEQLASYDKNGKVQNLARYDAVGRDTFYQQMNSDGSGTADSFDVYGRKTTSIQFHADGSRDVTLSDYFYTEGPPTSSNLIHYNQSNLIVSSVTSYADGTFKQQSFLSGETLTSHSEVKDTFISAQSGQDTFVFQPAFGQDLITNFHSGFGSNHDTVDLSALGIKLLPGTSTADFIYQHSLQAGTDTVLTLAPNEQITFQHVALNNLTKSDIIL